MLIGLTERVIERLSKELGGLSKSDKKNFHPHEFDIEAIRNLVKEKGNHYYIYLDELGEFAGYGMLRTFGKYEIPTLGSVIWQEHRGHGNGKRLVEELIDKAQELGYPKIQLRVYRSNKIAYEVYKKKGFKEIGESEDGVIWMEYGDRNAGDA